jgi:hypothetical protein
LQRQQNRPSSRTTPGRKKLKRLGEKLLLISDKREPERKMRENKCKKKRII